LHCIIADNGIGRKKSEELKSKSAEKQRSMGLQLTAERIALLNRNDKNAYLHIEDLVDADGKAAGTKVILEINYRQLTETPS